MKAGILKILIILGFFAYPILLLSSAVVPAESLPPNAKDWPHDTLHVKVARYHARDTLRSLTLNLSVNGHGANELITSISSELAKHHDPSYAPPARLYHLQEVNLRDELMVSTRWILEDRARRSWTAADQYILRAYVEQINATGVKADDPPLLDGHENAVPKSFSSDTDWAEWRQARKARGVE